VRIRRGADPDLIVRLADGSCAAIAMSWTDYAGQETAGVAPSVPGLLDLEGMRQAAGLVARLQREGARPCDAGA
jgi:hypothetical protein